MVSKTGAKATAAKSPKVYAPVKRVGPYPKFARKLLAKNNRKRKNREARQALTVSPDVMVCAPTAGRAE